jgi:hypothetical protein
MAKLRHLSGNAVVFVDELGVASEVFGTVVAREEMPSTV